MGCRGCATLMFMNHDCVLLFGTTLQHLEDVQGLGWVWASGGSGGNRGGVLGSCSTVSESNLLL